MNSIYPNKSFYSMILKIGGSILKDQNILLQNLEVIKNIIISKHNQAQDFPYSPSKILIICGGGIRAENLRDEFRKDLDTPHKNDVYHWKAIECMDLNAKELYDLFKSSFTKDDIKNYVHLISDIRTFQNSNWGIFIFQPSVDLKEYDQKPHLIPLEHSWSVTSDSISIFYGYRLGLKNVVFLKDISFLKLKNKLIQAIDSGSLLRSMEDEGYLQNIETHLGKGTLFPVDPFVPRFVFQYKINLVITNGMKTKLFRIFLKDYGKFVGKNFIGEYGIIIYP